MKIEKVNIVLLPFDTLNQLEVDTLKSIECNLTMKNMKSLKGITVIRSQFTVNRKRDCFVIALLISRND
ncbi:MAG: hypothetical protein PHV06_07110 [bacterium]|nr:hypothetical protein [bacterium]